MTDESPELPDDFFRGIRQEDWVGPGEHSVDQQAFYPDKSKETNEGFYPASINWGINEGAPTELLKRRKGGKVSFRGGVAELPTEELERLREQWGGEEFFTFSHDPVEEGENKNIYHGNLWFAKESKLRKSRQHSICGGLSKIVIRVIRQANIE